MVIELYMTRNGGINSQQILPQQTLDTLQRLRLRRHTSHEIQNIAQHPTMDVEIRVASFQCLLKPNCCRGSISYKTPVSDRSLKTRMQYIPPLPVWSRRVMLSTDPNANTLSTVPANDRSCTKPADHELHTSGSASPFCVCQSCLYPFQYPVRSIPTIVLTAYSATPHPIGFAV